MTGPNWVDDNYDKDWGDDDYYTESNRGDNWE